MISVARSGELVRERPELWGVPVVFAAFIALWAIGNRLGYISPFVFPAPTRVAEGLQVLLTAPWLPRHVATTGLEMVAGFLLAASTGFVVAVLLGHTVLVRRVLYPFLVVFQVIPKIALAPIFVIAFGFGVESKIAVAFAVAVFVVVVNTLAGMDRVPANALRLMKSLNASRMQVFLKLILPTSLPYVFAGLKVAATLSLIGAIVGEYITARAGLGRLIVEYSVAGQQYLVWALVVIVGGLGIAIYAAVTLAQRRFVWWRT